LFIWLHLIFNGISSRLNLANPFAVFNPHITAVSCSLPGIAEGFFLGYLLFKKYPGIKKAL